MDTVENLRTDVERTQWTTFSIICRHNQSLLEITSDNKNWGKGEKRETMKKLNIELQGVLKRA